MKKIKHSRRAGKAQNKYDVLRHSGPGKRRALAIESGSENWQLGGNPIRSRLESINLARDLRRNFPPVQSWMEIIRNNVVGPDGGKAMIHSDDADFSRAATKFFNNSFSKNCDFRGADNWNDILKNLLEAKKRDGDVLIIFDGGAEIGPIEDSGKIIIIEADHLTDISDWATCPLYSPTRVMDSGVITDQYGRPEWYIISARNGLTSAPYAEITPIPARFARLFREAWRPGAVRGISCLLSAAADMQDAYEMRQIEKQSAKAGARIVGVRTVSQLPETMPLTASELNEDGTPKTIGATTQYHAMEALTGGVFEYVEPGESIDLKSFDRPSTAFREFSKDLLKSAGASLGLAQCFSLSEVSTSYTAFRGEQLITWQTLFSPEQKNLERYVCDYIATRAIEHAIRKGKLDAPKSPWEISWSWPVMKPVDPLKDAQAQAKLIGSALADYSEILGPNWRDTFDALKTQIAHARLGETQLPLLVFGAENPVKDQNEEQQKKENEDE